METISSTEDVQLIKTLQNNINSISYSEIKNARSVKVIDYGVTLKGYWHDHIVIMKHISPELVNRDNEMLKQLLHKLSMINHPNILQFFGTSTGRAQISNPVFLELNINASSSISLQGEMIAFTDSKLLNDLNSNFTTASDIYSLGVVMWSISSGKLPFENFTSQIDLVNRIVLENIRENPVDGTPQAYIDLYQRCWGLNSEKRPSAQEVCIQLEANLQKESWNEYGEIIYTNDRIHLSPVVIPLDCKVGKGVFSTLDFLAEI
ncbi:10342_t:CDS:2 [Gigaspora margarita]|uniref:10342_t:CDS:1 n=1 Tax=Gigaspora margarita TaxID=4874 RepID=A0ABM8W5K6_GIGMA|nr:10342_t:CDS:2 [Gigaspora margarita]